MKSLFPSKITILGEPWVIKIKTRDEEEILEYANGYCQHLERLIVICDLREEEGIKDGISMMKHAMRHELCHAVIFESGIGFCSDEVTSWGTHEEMVDFWAKQSLKLFELYKKCGVAYDR